VINQKPPEGRFVSRPKEFQLLPGVPEAIARLNSAGMRTIVVSNQRGIALGLYSAADIDAIHHILTETLSAHGASLDAILYCPHDYNACRCRKPLPGMFEDAVRQFPEISAEESVMIGDTFVDIEFGRRLGMATILVDSGTASDGRLWEPPYLSGVAQHKPDLAEAIQLADWRVNSLPAAVDLLLGEEQ
jgi:D-glycero-D-manno-heptose 1,7-bisphosphate phosphatase